MPARDRMNRLLGVLAPVLLAGVLAGQAPAAASAASCQSWVGGQPPSPGTDRNDLSGVTVLSACNVWAVGSHGAPDRTLIEHWDGADWTVVPSPTPGQGVGGARLFGVRAVSATSIWAVGFYSTATNREKTLILRWDGTKWAQVASPSPGTGAQLLSVRVISASDAWAVGTYFDGSTDKTLTLHWNGTAWVRVGSPGVNSELNSVAATSHGDVWAVGAILGNVAARPLGQPLLPGRHPAAGDRQQTLILHWNGSKWARVPSPNPGQFGGFLNGVGATSASNAWAVGSVKGSAGERTLILHWDGTKWAQVASPSVAGTGAGAFLVGVNAPSSSTAFAVGGSFSGSTEQTFAVRWDGSSWKRVNVPNPGAGGELFGVGSASASSVWAVGAYAGDSGTPLALAVHCC